MERSPNSVLDLPNGGVFRRAYNRVFIQKSMDSYPSFEYEVAGAGAYLASIIGRGDDCYRCGTTYGLHSGG